MKNSKSILCPKNNSEELDISSIIERFTVINKERSLINSQISKHYTPLLMKAAKNGHKKKYDELLKQLPDCPFLLTAYRIGQLHGLRNYNK